MVTLKDIAKDCGVAVSVVSDTLNGKTHSRVSPEKRELILRRARELDYHPNMSARKLRSQKQYCIGVLMSVTSGGQTTFLLEIQKQLNAKNYSGIFAFWETEEDVALAYDNILPHNVDGIITFHYDPRLEKARIPTVFYGRGAPGYDQVFLDYPDYARQAVAYLRGLGHKRIAHIGEEGFVRNHVRDAMRDKELVLSHGIDVPRPMCHSTAHGAMGEFLRVTKDLPTAIIATTDDVAVGCMVALREHGLRIPEDVSVMGFNNRPEAGFTVPPLTTFDIQIPKIAEALVETLMRRMSNPEDDIRMEFMKLRLVERESCRKIGGGR